MVATLLVGALAGCSGGSDSPAPATSTATVPGTVTADKVAAPTPTAAPVWPLTGVAGEPVQRPALAVKVENTDMARPQSGLDQADVVWETIVEFEVSRLVAVFQSQVPPTIGPVRSVRPMDLPIISPLHGLFAYSGGQPGILALVGPSGAQSLSHDSGVDGLARISTRSAPHNVYADPTKLWAQADAGHQASPSEQFAFAPDAAQATAVTAGTPASQLAFNLSSYAKPQWSWDAASGTWLRSEGTTPATVATGARISAVNIVSITASHPDSGFDAQHGAPVPTYNLVGSGDGFIATGGKTIAVTWKKDAQDKPLQLFLPDGSPATLAPGNTWVELVPLETGKATIS